MFVKAIRISLSVALVLFSLVVRAAETSSGTGSIIGTVKDAAGAVLPGAQVVLKPTATTVATDAEGNFLVPDLTPGSYTVSISYVGFTTSTATVMVNAGPPTTLNTTL